MTISTRYEQITAADGGTFEAYCAVPDGGHGPGIVMFQEIFGINDNMRTLADRMAGEGYVVLVPDMFWRIEPRFERKDESGLGDAMALMASFDPGLAIDDAAATHAHLVGMDECTGKSATMGFCLGGGLAFATAAQSRVGGRGPDAAVSYYGSAVNDMLGMVDSIECPVLFHYGADDPFIPPDKIDEVETAVVGRPGVEFHRYAGAGHAFSNWDAPSMYRAEAADQAWERTLTFLADHLR